ITMVQDMAHGYQPPAPPTVQLAAANMTEKMASFMQDGIDRGDFLPHDKTVAMAIASIMVRGTGDAAVVDETKLFARERAAFIRLAKTAETAERIASMMDHGAPVRN
ncbi:MAG: 3-hydroxyacyl-CoA dehydrogenase, partial [Candidatus Puniceispirillum sp.]